uniref:ATP-grasp_2 domain-containing protein n=1 Tax=Macrostomum lignano TaxID=282301 RepID=A0A1I8FIL7_9PLAT
SILGSSSYVSSVRCSCRNARATRHPRPGNNVAQSSLLKFLVSVSYRLLLRRTVGVTNSASKYIAAVSAECVDQNSPRRRARRLHTSGQLTEVAACRGKCLLTPSRSSDRTLPLCQCSFREHPELPSAGVCHLSARNLSIATRADASVQCCGTTAMLTRSLSSRRQSAASASGLFRCCRRWLNLQEYQSKKLMQDYGVNVQSFVVADNAQSASKLADSFKPAEYVIKAQILAGGRGKGVFDTGFKGGVHLTKEPAKVAGLVQSMLGHKLVTKQTGKEGVMVSKVMVAEALDISRETYLAILMDRESGGPVVVGSPQGGMDIEEVAAKSPDAIFKEVVDINKGLTREQADRMADCLGFSGPRRAEAAEQILKLYSLFQAVDCTQVRLNAFVLHF